MRARLTTNVFDGKRIVLQPGARTKTSDARGADPSCSGVLCFHHERPTWSDIHAKSFGLHAVSRIPNLQHIDL
jgi:hypothetical protein